MVFIAHKADAGGKSRVCYFFADSILALDERDGGRWHNPDAKTGICPVQRCSCIIIFAENLKGKTFLIKNRKKKLFPAAVKDEGRGGKR